MLNEQVLERVALAKEKIRAAPPTPCLAGLPAAPEGALALHRMADERALDTAAETTMAAMAAALDRYLACHLPHVTIYLCSHVAFVPDDTF